MKSAPASPDLTELLGRFSELLLLEDSDGNPVVQLFVCSNDDRLRHAMETVINELVGYEEPAVLH